MVGCFLGQDFDVLVLHTLVLCVGTVSAVAPLAREKGLGLPCSSATLMRNWFRSSRTCLRPLAMKSSNLSVKRAIRSRRSSKPKLMAGRLSAIEGASAVESGARMALVESDDSNSVDIFMRSGS